MKLPEFKLNEKLLRRSLVIPIAIIVIALLCIGITHIQHDGQILRRGVDFEGGVQLTVHYTEKVDTIAFASFIETQLKATESDVVTTTDPTTREQKTLVISVGGNVNETDLISAVEKYLNIKLEPTTYSMASLTPLLAGSFWSQALTALTFAFLFMAVVVALNYRKFMPSLAIVVSTLLDLLAVVGFMAITHMPLTLVTFGALLMIIGYSVDTNILLTNKLQKEKEGEVYDRLTSGLKTGLTLSLTTLASLVALLFIGGAYSTVFSQISVILLIGLLADIPNTWSLNANMLLWHKKP